MKRVHIHVVLLPGEFPCPGKELEPRKVPDRSVRRVVRRHPLWIVKSQRSRVNWKYQLGMQDPLWHMGSVDRDHNRRWWTGRGQGNTAERGHHCYQENERSRALSIHRIGFSHLHSLPGNLAHELYVAGPSNAEVRIEAAIIGGRRNERAVCGAGRRLSKVGVIERIEETGSEFKREALPELECSLQRYIPSLQSRC